MFDNKWQKKEMPLVSLIGMGGGIASPAFLASIVLNILKPTVFSPVDDTGVPDFDYTAESSEITDVTTSSINLTGTSGSFIPGSYVKDANSTIIPSDIASVDGSTINFSSAVDLTSVTAPLEMVDASGNPIAPTTSNVTTTTSIPGSSVATNYKFTYPNGTSIGSPKLINSAANMYPGNSMPIGDRMLWIKSSNGSNNAISDSVALNGRTLFTDSSDESNLFSGGVEFGEGYTRLPYDIASLGTTTAGDETFATEIGVSPGLLDIVTWTGSGTLDHDRRIPHSLGSVPGMIIVKRIDGNQDWYVYHSAKGVNSYQALNNGTAFVSGWNFWGSAPTETDFGINEDNLNTKDINSEYVAYVFAEDTPGKIKCGTYTGNGGDNFINVGFQPNFVLIKEQNNSGYNWVAANTFTMTSQRYWHPGYPTNLLGSSNDYINNNSTSFHLKGSDSHFNQGGRSYLYLAVSGNILSPDTTRLTFQDNTNLDQLTSGMTVTSDDPNQSITGTLASDADLSTNTVIVNATSWPTGDSVTGPAVTATASGFEENPTLTLTDTTVSRVSDGSLIGGTSIDQVLTVGETVQADTAVSSTVNATVFSTTLYQSGSGNEKTITTGIDNTDESLVWIKSTTLGYHHKLMDSERGSSYPALSSDNTYPETGDAGIKELTSDGFVLHGGGYDKTNDNNNNGYVAWNFRAAPGFFDVVTWTGDASGAGSRTLSHSLNGAVGTVIVKCTSDSSDWMVWHKSLSGGYLNLNETRVTQDPSNTYVSSTNSDFTITYDGSYFNYWNGNGRTYVAYVFADDTPGLIKCGSYSSSGEVVNLGFRPQWLMIKSVDNSNAYTGDWRIFDTTRGIVNGDGDVNLWPNEPREHQPGVAESAIDLNENGFTVEGQGAYGTSTIYIAIAENAETGIPRDIYASGTVSASSGNTITLSNTTGTWSTGMKIQGTDSDTKDNPDPISVENVSLTSSAPTAERNVSTWGDAVWEIATDENFTQNVQTATTALSATGTQAGPSFTLQPNTGYYTRTKYTALGQESEWSDVTYFVTTQNVYVDDVFSVDLYSPNGLTTTVTNGIDFAGEGGMVIKKRRDAAQNWILMDTERGDDRQLYPNSTSAETTGNTVLTSGGFTSTGLVWDTGGHSGDIVNFSFRKAPGFFDVVTYTGNGTAGRTIAHNLGSVPGFIIVKNRTYGTSTNWRCYHRSLGTNKHISLDRDTAASTNYQTWNDTAPTSTVFSVGSGSDVNASGNDYVAYVFAHDDARFGTNSDESIIKCGSYTGNGSESGNVIDLGFEPQWLMIRRTSSSDPWNIWDTMRGMTNGSQDPRLEPNTSDPEDVFAGVNVLPTGFELASSTGFQNSSGETYIYMAIRRPHKPPTVVSDVFAIDTKTPSSANTPSYISNFPVDLALRRDNITSTSDSVEFISRLTNSLMYANYSSAENSGGFLDWFAYNNGWASTNGNDSNDYLWMFRRAPGFFDMVAYTGNGTYARTDLKVNMTPELVITKRRDSSSAWGIHFAEGGSAYRAYFSNSAGSGGMYDVPSAGDPGRIGMSSSANGTWNVSGGKYVSYCFSSLDGISKVGSYTAAGAGAKEIDCGFTNGAAFVLVKNVSSSGDWYLLDSERGINAYNETEPYVTLNTNNSQQTANMIGYKNTGFMINGSSPLNNGNDTYIFLAIANP